jgi:hypothetical protein
MITEAHRNSVKAWQWANPEKKRAHSDVAWALKKGLLVRPDVCERCKEPGYTVGHHADYSKPLEVEWLCDRCHVRHHKAEKAAMKTRDTYDSKQVRTHKCPTGFCDSFQGNVLHKQNPQCINFREQGCPTEEKAK